MSHEPAENSMETTTQKLPENGQPGSDLFGLSSRYFEPPFYYSCGSIWGSGPGAEKMLDLRGWGHLTGQGAHGLSAIQAEKIQDELGEHIAKLLTASWPNVKGET